MAAFRFLVIAVIILAGVLLKVGVVAALLAVRGFAAGVEQVASELRIETGPQTTIVFDRHNRQIFTFFREHRIDVPLDRVSPHVIAAVLAAEDRRFFLHRGLDARRVVGAAWANYRAGRIVQGGSTITQQLARAAALGRERNFLRKFREVFLAAEIEERYPKRQILEAYLNKVYFGNGFYGVEAAARGYFGTSAATLQIEEAALLAGVIRAPSSLTPAVHADRARQRRNVVLRAMHDARFIDEREYRQAVAAPVNLVSRAPDRAISHRESTEDDGREEDPQALYFREELRRELVRRFGAEQVYEGGLRVFSTLDPDMQREAELAIARRLSEVTSDRRFQNRLRSEPAREAEHLQAALVALEPSTGHVLAIVGGRDFGASEFNRATQARRQPGSAFKPVIFAAALEKGYGPGSVIQALSEPIDTSEGPWLPAGASEASTYTLRHALQVSSNRAAAQLLQEVGIDAALDVARRLGILSPLPAVPSLALGTGEVTLLELTSAFGAFSNTGLFVEPSLIRRVERQDGSVLWENPQRGRPAVSAETAFLMSSMLADVIRAGTANRVRQLGFTRPAAGKTGTTDNYADAWFVGYTPRIVTGVWVGFDQPATIMQDGFGGTLAVPAWTYFMERATEGHEEGWFERPAGMQARGGVSVERTASGRRTPYGG